MSETEVVPSVIQRRPYQGTDSFAAEQEDLVFDRKGYILKKPKPEPQTQEEVLQEELDTAEKDDSLGAQEKTYAKRYGDLRSHSTKQLAASAEREKALKEQLEIATAQQSTRSMDDEALDEFSKENPEAAEVFTNLAQRETERTMDEVNSLRTELAEATLQNDMTTARLFVQGEHSDIDEIEQSDEFHAWVESKSQRIQDGVYANATDGETLANIVSAYKAETGISTEKADTKRKDLKAAASELVGVKGKSEPSTQEKPTFSRKDIAAMNLEEYEVLEDAILLARAEGRITD